MPLLTKSLRDILELLIQRGLVQLFADGELTVYTLLRDVEVLHVEEPILADRLNERLRKLLLALWGVVQTQVDGDQVRPIKVCLIHE